MSCSIVSRSVWNTDILLASISISLRSAMHETLVPGWIRVRNVTNALKYFRWQPHFLLADYNWFLFTLLFHLAIIVILKYVLNYWFATTKSAMQQYYYISYLVSWKQWHKMMRMQYFYLSSCSSSSTFNKFTDICVQSTEIYLLIIINNKRKDTTNWQIKTCYRTYSRLH
jgi:ABC-type multidrug transport system fused ATPase/permease subunit